MDTLNYRFKKGEEPRERLERQGVRSLSDQELLMILLGQGNAQRGIEEISRDVLSLLDKGQNFPLSSLMNIPGVGRAKGATILASMEFGRRKNIRKPKQYTSHSDIFMEIRHFAGRSQESLIVLSFNGAMELLDTTVATVGFVNQTFIHPREIFSEALKKRASFVIVAHNHPSGILIPSREDIAGTARIMTAGDILGIPVVDHLIFTESAYYSFADHGLLRKIREGTIKSQDNP